MDASERLKAAILDIDAHATPMGEDDDGFVTGGYLISVGCLHRALALTGTAPRCVDCEGHDAHDLRAANQDMWNAMQYACNHPEDWRTVISAALNRHRSAPTEREPAESFDIEAPRQFGSSYGRGGDS